MSHNRHATTAHARFVNLSSVSTPKPDKKADRILNHALKVQPTEPRKYGQRVTEDDKARVLALMLGGSSNSEVFMAESLSINQIQGLRKRFQDEGLLGKGRIVRKD